MNNNVSDDSVSFLVVASFLFSTKLLGANWSSVLVQTSCRSCWILCCRISGYQVLHIHSTWLQKDFETGLPTYEVLWHYTKIIIFKYIAESWNTEELNLQSIWWMLKNERPAGLRKRIPVWESFCSRRDWVKPHTLEAAAREGWKKGERCFCCFCWFGKRCMNRFLKTSAYKHPDVRERVYNGGRWVSR